LLTEDRNLPACTAVCFQKAEGLHEHAARSTAGVVDGSSQRFSHLDEEKHNGGRRIELTAAPSLCRREAAQEVLVRTAKDVPLALAVEMNRAEEVDKARQAARVDVVKRKVRRKDPGELRVFLLEL